MDAIENPLPVTSAANAPSPRGSLAGIFAEFTRLGLTSFGGPIAHIGYFRDAFVVRKRWISDGDFADLVALCQFLPGPASSQVGFAIGVMRGGLAGGMAAWAGFTLPSVLLLLLFAYGAGLWQSDMAHGVLHGLKIVAVAVVAQAVWGMARSFCATRVHASVMVAAVAATIFVNGAAGQLLAIAIGAMVGLLEAPPAQASPQPRSLASLSAPVSRRSGVIVLMLAGLLLALSFIPWHLPAASLFSAFYQAGALVFGGGHVILPLLESSMVATGRVGADAFLAGYGAAQAVPGPLFTFAAYLGAINSLSPSGLTGASIALAGIFLPGLLLVWGILPFWAALKERRHIRMALSGINAAVVGLLLSALYHPVWTSAIVDGRDFTLAAAAMLLLMVWKWPPWVVVVLTALGGMAFSL